MQRDYKNFTLSVEDGGIAVFKVNRPAVKNAMNTESWVEFADFLTWAQANPEIRVIIVSGEGDGAFIAGADIKEFSSSPSVDGLFSNGTTVVQLLNKLQKPVIAAINGVAFGGGFEVAMACDLRIVAEETILGLPELTLGVVPGLGGTQRLCKLIGVGRAKEVIMAGKNIRGADAVGMGLAYKCVPMADVMPEAMKLAKKLLERGPYATALVKRLMHIAFSTDEDTGLMMENLSFCTLMEGAEMKEGTDAFFEKRKPVF